MKSKYERILKRVIAEDCGTFSSPDTVYADRGPDVNFRGPDVTGFKGSGLPEQIPVNLKLKVPRKVRLSPMGRLAVILAKRLK